MQRHSKRLTTEEWHDQGYSSHFIQSVASMRIRWSKALRVKHITSIFPSPCFSSITFNESWSDLQRSRETDTITPYYTQQTIAYWGKLHSTLQSSSHLTDYVSVAIRSKCQCRKHPHPPLSYTLILEIKHVTCTCMILRCYHICQSEVDQLKCVCIESISMLTFIDYLVKFGASPGRSIEIRSSPPASQSCPRPGSKLTLPKLAGVRITKLKSTYIICS
jgi:hypothetical protein